jgi:Na+/H+ antiporter NhaD/arsenite permease-like protein
LLVTLLACAACHGASPAAAATEGAEGALGASLPIWSAIPFAGILLSIAFFPLVAPRWWHHHFPKVSAFWALLLAVPFIFAFRGRAIHEILHVYLTEYIPFIILLWTLFAIAGGIYVRGTLRGTPETNVVLLLIATAFASWVGTTGASMIFIRPVLRANASRRRNVHVVVFFILLVSNIGGSLTPLGDPPLFLGFLQGVPFFWTLGLLPETLFVAIPLLLVFYLWDRFFYRRETKQAEAGEKAPVRIEGTVNLFLLLGVVAAVLASGLWHPGSFTFLGIHIAIESVARDVGLIALGATSLRLTRKEIHEANGFSWFPMKEVGILFAGIFITIIPAIAILKAGDQGALGTLIATLQTPSHYFWVTGSLSGFLDNAPSYLTFFNSLLGKFFAHVPPREAVHLLIAEQRAYLQAISVGAVFFGAMTYIGNAPNFMVKSIAEEAGVRMPSFFGYMLRYSVPLLIPLFFLVGVVFF